MKNILVLLLLAVIMNCSGPEKTTYEITVENIGMLRSIMHQGQFQSRVKLDTLVKPGMFGVGASDSLSGELLIFNGEVFEATVLDSALQLTTNQAAEATLLVYSIVSKWDTLNVTSIDDLEASLIEKSAMNDLQEPFPFILTGSPVSADYHVINFDPKMSDFSNHKEGSYTGKIEAGEATILGFYATNAKGIYTHHDSNLHMHIISENNTEMGHVDALDLGIGDFKLLIPEQ